MDGPDPLVTSPLLSRSVYVVRFFSLLRVYGCTFLTTQIYFALANLMAVVALP